MLKNDIKKYDSKNVLASVELFYAQCKKSWDTTIYKNDKNEISNILVIGMGGSALGAQIIQSLNILKVPMHISNEYTIPEWVNKNTLVLAMSYSGSTEETVEALNYALTKKANVIGITTGGKLAEILKKKKLPLCLIDKTDNPCGQPRFAVGSMMMIMLRIFIHHKLCRLNTKDISSALSELESEKVLNDKSLEKKYNQISKLKDKILVLVYAEHLSNVGLFARNQIHETSKTFAVTHNIPELNHHLMEGLSYPASNKNILHFIFTESTLYSDKIQKRISVTKEVLKKQKIKSSVVEARGGSHLSEVLIQILDSMYFAYLLGITNKKDPSDIRWVDYFKAQLSK